MTPATTATKTPVGPPLRAWTTLVGAEAKMVVRDTAGLIVPIGLPVLILVMNGLGAGRQELVGTGGLTVLDVYVLPLVVTMVTAVIGVVNMPSFLSYYRKSGVLRQLAVTPAHPAMVLVAQVVVSVLQTAAGLALAMGIAMLAFGANLPLAPWLTLGVVALAAAAMYAVGMLVAAVAPTGNASVAIGLGLFFAMGATGGMFGPRENLPDALATLGEALPFGAAVDAVGAAWAGNAPETMHMVSLGVTIVVSSLLAARFFRWE